MWKFIKYVLATFLGTVLGVIVIILIGIGLLAGITATVMNDSTVTISENSLLVINLDAPIVERVSSNPLKNLNLSSLSKETEYGIHDLVNAILTAKDDDNVKGIFLNTPSVNAGVSTIDEIRNALIRFKESGKFIISYNEYYTQGGYYLSSVADRIYLKPEGVVEFKGLSASAIFFKDALKKIGIDPQVIKQGKFKSAVEPFIADKMSPENRMQIQSYVDILWKHILNGVAAYRKVEVEDLNNIAEELKIRNATTSLEYGLVDELKYYDQILTELKDSLKIDQTSDINSIRISDYISNNSLLNNNNAQTIAVVIASGNIVSGNGEEDNIGGERIARAIRKARTDENVKAIILRINSGGGSALASESIWREAYLSTQTKPFIVSMGDVAASGGYYIACPASYIIANPTTVTGSIGVFGILPNAENLLDKIGIATEVVNTNKYSDIGSITRALTNKERETIETSIGEIYNTFIRHVAEGRDMSIEMADSIGQGRIWTGVEALNLGLVDMLGDMQSAIRVAVDMSGAENYKIQYLPEVEDPFQKIMKAFSNTQDAKIKELLGDTYFYYEGIKNANMSKGIYTKMPFDLRVE